MRTGSQIRSEILQDCYDTNYDYAVCEEYILADCTEDEIVAYNLYMTKITGVCSVSNVYYSGGY